MRVTEACGALALVALCGLGQGRPALAADMPAYGAPPMTSDTPDTPLEFGTGWYLRGDASFGPEDQPKLLLQSTSNILGGSTASFDRKGSDFGYGFGGGAGYKFNDFFRADLTADYLDPFRYKINTDCGLGCVFNQSTNVWRWDGLFNGYLDLGTWAGLTPYVGAGAGVSGTHQDGSIGVNGLPLTYGIQDPKTGAVFTSSIPSHTDYRFAWAGMAGVSYAVASHMLLDVGYRYLDLGTTKISLFPSTSVSKNLNSQEVRVGIRYMID